jgi:hypothetical protein
VNGVTSFDVQKQQNIPDKGFTDYSNIVLDKGIRAQGASIPRDAENHFVGRTSYNLNKNNDQTLALIAALQEILAHNSAEYDSTAEYAPEDVCYVVGHGEGFNRALWYQRISQTPDKIINIPPSTTLHWKPVFPALGQPQLPALHFEQAETFENIVSGERLETIFGKLQRWFVEFLDKLSEISNSIPLKSHPVGCFYTQYPAANSNVYATAFPEAERPSTLFGGVWTMVFESERIFFRTGGSLAADNLRTAGLQQDAIRDITGLIYYNALWRWGEGSMLGCFILGGPPGGSADSGTGSDIGGISTYFSANANSNSYGNPMAGRANGDDIRPKNRRIIVWKRTA